MSQILKYKSISLKVNMKKSVVKKDTRALIAKKVDLIRRKLITLARIFDNVEKILRMSKPTSRTPQGCLISSEYNLLISAQKDFCSKFIKAINVIDTSDKKHNQHLARNDVDITQISLGVEDFVDKLENGIIHLPPLGFTN